MPQDGRMDRQMDRQTDVPDSESKTSGSFEEEAYKWQVWHLQTEVALVGKVNAAGIPPGPPTCTCCTTSYLRHRLDLCQERQPGWAHGLQAATDAKLKA